MDLCDLKECLSKNGGHSHRPDSDSSLGQASGVNSLPASGVNSFGLGRQLANPSQTAAGALTRLDRQQ